MVAKIIGKKKTNETVEEELLNSIRETNAVEELRLKIDNLTDPGESFAIINDYEEMIKPQNKKTKEYVAKQGEMLKNFRIWKILL